MNKKEIYEHLANIYLDASSKSSKKKNKLSPHPKAVRSIIILGLVTALGLASTVTYFHINNRNSKGQIALFLYQDAAKINFNFDPAKKETFSINLKQLNLSKYKALGFSVRKTNPKDIISLRVEFINRFNEKSEVYIKNISGKWTEERLDFSRFTRMNDWTQMKVLAFSIEEWNTREKSGIVYLDNIKVIKQ
ncbi:MAG: hypothetical protein PHP73_03250 [Candidatus Omnitrophica bacterium]|nr:hypothetical protein [Candidatus Omnitrophota bacterium]